MKKTIINYNQAVRFIESLSNTAASQKGRDVEIIKERLRNVKRFLKFLGNPEKKLKIIHIAGTSGKGSVVAMLHSILQADNKKVGSYTSPHTTTYCERIKVGDKYISEKELIDAVNFLKDRMDEYMQRDANISNYTRMPRKNTRIESHSSRHSCAFAFFESRLSLNFFEFSFCLAIYYFAKQHCEYAVIETGCGGRYDASNAIKKPVYTIITNIGPDHLDIFGNLKNIANEKAGIIKSGVPLLTGETDKRWINMFKKELELLHCYIAILLKKINYADLKNIETNLNGTSFEYKNEKYNLQLVGEHQARNATLAIECANDLKINNIGKGLERAFYPARMEVISINPTIIIDGAHNEDKLQALLRFLTPKTYNSKPNKKYLIFALAKNKQVTKVLPQLLEFFDVTYLTRFSNPFRKVMNYSDWLTKFAKSDKNKLYYKHYAKDALVEILPKLKKDDLLVITGSIFLAGELREHWCSEEEIVKNRKSIF